MKISLYRHIYNATCILHEISIYHVYMKNYAIDCNQLSMCQFKLKLKEINDQLSK